ncbi:ORF6N domain-containing protein [Candidatus Peregrinibacteria bacterium]|nr:ORF6N domain-containing protein [Candidatus Peregrinibacteria bacterium]
MTRAITLPHARIERKIFLIRGKKVILDNHLAALYDVKTKALNQAVRRNIKRFPADFMFRLNNREMKIWSLYMATSNLRSQIVTSSYGGRRYHAYAFTEQGVAMLSSVLNSERAIQVNIQIMRTFTKLREMLATHRELKEKIEKLEKRYDKQFRIIFDVIKKLLAVEEKPKQSIGFRLT